MRQLRYCVAASLDGYIAGPNGEYDWIPMDEYVGQYAFAPVSTITVSWVGDRFFVQPTDRSRVEVFASSETDFFLEAGAASVTFGRDREGGPVTHLILHQSAGDRRANRMAGIAADDRPTSIPEGLPEASTLFARHLEARGGGDALGVPGTVELTGTVAIAPVGVKGTFRFRFGRDLRFTSVVNLGPTSQGYSSNVGWSISPQGGPEVLQGSRLEQLKFEANWLADNQYDRLYTRLHTVAEEVFHGFECLVVEATNAAGERSKVYFEKKTGLVRGRSRMAHTGAGATPTVTVVRSYRAFGDLLVPTEIEVTMPALGVRSIMIVEAVEYDTLATEVFDVPSQIVEQIGR